MKRLGLGLGVLMAIAVTAGCGGGGSSSPAPAPTATPAPPAPTPSPSPSPGPLTLAYTSSFGATSSAAVAPAPLGFPAPTLTATLTAAQANYTGAFGATSSCPTIVSVTPTSSATGTFTVTANDATTAACTISVTGATGFAGASLGSSVLKPAGVVLRWYTPQSIVSGVPIPQTASPINLVGLGTTFQAYLAISEQNYVGGFPAANVTNAGCGANYTIAANASAPAGLPTPAPPTATSASSLQYYTVSAPTSDVLPIAGTCTITALDAYTPLSGAANPAASISVQVTSTTGTVQ